MNPKNPRQRLARRLTWTLGLALLPFACFGFLVPTSRIHHNGSSRLTVDKFTDSIQRDDWPSASKCYAKAGKSRAELMVLLGLPRHEPLPDIEFVRSENYFLPFTGEHEVYTYALHRDHHTARMNVDAVATRQSWRIDSVRLSP